MDKEKHLDKAEGKTIDSTNNKKQWKAPNITQLETSDTKAKSYYSTEFGPFDGPS